MQKFLFIEFYILLSCWTDFYIFVCLLPLRRKERNCSAILSAQYRLNAIARKIKQFLVQFSYQFLD